VGPDKKMNNKIMEFIYIIMSGHFSNSTPMFVFEEK